MDLNEDCEIVAESKLTHNGRTVFEIGHSAASCTEIPGFYPHEGAYYIDCPGL